jgi:hypothetical protein
MDSDRFPVTPAFRRLANGDRYPPPERHPALDPDPRYADPRGGGDYPGRTWRVAVYDASGRLVLNGHATESLIDAISNLADGLTIRYGEPDAGYAGRERVVLPLRPQSQPDANPNPLTVTPDPHAYVGDPPTPVLHFDGAPVPDAYRHAHRDPHTDPYDPFRVAYRHAHQHFHRGDVRHPHGAGADGDAALHDHDH